MNITTAFVCFFSASENNTGAAKVSYNFFKQWKNNKKLFQFTSNKKIKKKKYLKNVYLRKENALYKILNLPNIIFHIYQYLKNKKKPILILEGASWIFFSFVTFFVLKFFIKNLKVIYHGHNIEYEVRKNSFLIKKLTFYFEKIIYNKVDIGTVVSKRDKNKISKIYKSKSYVFPNGYYLNDVKIKKINIPKKFILFNGSYGYWPNKIAINKILNIYHPIITKKYKDIHFIFTGNNFPKKFFKTKKTKFFQNLSDQKYKYVLKKSMLLFFPIPKSPGTKVKVIEGLCEGKTIVATKPCFLGIDVLKGDKSCKFTTDKEGLIKLRKAINNSKITNKNKFQYQKKYLLKYSINKLICCNEKVFN